MIVVLITLIMWEFKHEQLLLIPLVHLAFNFDIWFVCLNNKILCRYLIKKPYNKKIQNNNWLQEEKTTT